MVDYSLEGNPVEMEDLEQALYYADYVSSVFLIRSYFGTQPYSEIRVR